MSINRQTSMQMHLSSALPIVVGQNKKVHGKHTGRELLTSCKSPKQQKSLPLEGWDTPRKMHSMMLQQ